MRNMKPVISLIILQFFFGVVVFSSKALAVYIEFPEEELSSESVLPIFDSPTPVKKRNVETEGRIELGLITGLSLNDPFFSPFVLGGMVTYHINEDHGVQLFGEYLSHTTSQYDAAIKAAGPPPSTTNGNISGQNDFSLAPSPQTIFLASWEWTPFYGKASFSKHRVFNQTLNLKAGAGVVGPKITSTSLKAF